MATQTTFGQTDAAARAIVTSLTTGSATFCLGVSPVRLFARKLDLASIPEIGQAVMIQVVPGDDLSDRLSMNGLYDDTFGVHVLMLQRIADLTSGGISESQAALLMQLRSEIIEWLCARQLACPAAVHPFAGAQVISVRHGKEGAYDLSRLETEAALFYSDIIFTYRAVGLHRRT